MQTSVLFSVFALGLSLGSAIVHTMAFSQLNEQLPSKVLHAIQQNPEQLLHVMRQGVYTERLRQLKAIWQKQTQSPIQLFPRKDNALHGSSGPILEVFTSYTCPHCRQAFTTLQRLNQQGIHAQFSLRFVANDPLSMMLARLYLALAEHDPQKALQWHTQSLAQVELWRQNKTQPLQEAVHQFALAFGMSPDFITTALTSERFSRILQDDQQQARRLGINATPFFVLAGRLTIQGAVPEDVFKAAIQEATALPAPTPVPLEHDSRSKPPLAQASPNT